MGQSPKIEQRRTHNNNIPRVSSTDFEQENAYEPKDYRVHGEATLDLSHDFGNNDNNNNNVSVTKSSFSLPTSHEPSRPVLSTHELQQSRVFDGTIREDTPQSTQKGNYVYHSTPPMQLHPPPKHQVDLSMPNVDSKNNYHSSYQQSHTGELPSLSDRVMPVSSSTFNSSLDFSDGDSSSRLPYKSTQQQSFSSYPSQDVVHYSPPSPQINLSMPNVDPKDSYHSSYQQSHTGERPSSSQNDISVPRTTFQSSLALDDGQKYRDPPQSTQRGNYVSFPTSTVEHHPPPKPQVDLSMPNVNAKDSFHSTYNQSHTGELPSPRDNGVQVPRTTFQSSLAFDDGEKNRAPAQSTQQGNFVSYPARDVEHYTPPRPQVDLSQPNVNPRDHYNSSYKQSHTGEPQSVDSIVNIPRTTFQSSLQFSDGDANTAPRQSTQQRNYVAHPTLDVVHYTPPRTQIDISQPNVNSRESYQSSYKQSHRGDTPSVEDEVTHIPRTAFQSSLVFNNGDATPAQSTQKGSYVTHTNTRTEPQPPPQAQISLAMPNVDPRESYTSSYRQSHKGEPVTAGNEAVASSNTAFTSSITLEDADRNRAPRQSTQRDNFVSHPGQEVEYYAPPRAQISLGQPGVDSRDTFKSSYRDSHTGEALPQGSENGYAPRTTFQSSIVLEDADRDRASKRSTQQDNYVHHSAPEVERYAPPRGQIDLVDPTVDPKSSFQSSYKSSHKGEAPSVRNEVEPAPNTTFRSSIVLEDADRNRTPHKSTQQDNFVSHPRAEVEHYTLPKAQISLSQPNVDPKDSYSSSYQSSHKGEALAPGDEVHVPRTAFTSSIALEDADSNNASSRRSTQQENYVYHATPDVEHPTPPKAQISLSQPNVDPKDSFQSSYKSSHKGEAPSARDEVNTVPQTAFKSSITLDDANNDRAPRRSTQQENFTRHSTPDYEYHAPPKAQINLADPNLDPRDSFQSSYKSSHRGDTPAFDDEVESVPRTAFKSNITLEDADNNKAPRRSTQQDNYVQHSTPEPERYTTPQPQISLKQPNIDPKDAYTSSYKNSHKGEPLSGDDVVQAPRTAFKSSIALEDAEKDTAPRKSTQKENYVFHPTQEKELYAPPKSHINLTQPDVDPRESYTSSYKNSHKGDAPVEVDDEVQPTRTAFKSSLNLEDADKNRTPRKSTQQENFVYHTTPEIERHAPPKGQISLAQPNFDSRDAYTSSYKNSHTGEPSAEDEVVQAPRSAFKSSLALEDADKNKAPRKSTQQENYVHHSTPEVERPTPPKSQFSLAHAEVDPKESYKSSYKNSHKGEPLADDDVAQVPRTAFKSSIALEDADKNKTPRKSTQQENYTHHYTPELERHTPPKAQINLADPNFDPRDSFQSSYKSSHRGDTPVFDDQVESVPRTAFKSNITLEDADNNKAPRRSTQQDNYVQHSTPEFERYTPPAQINLTQPNVDPKDAYTSSYKNSHKGDLPQDDDVAQAPRIAFKSSIALEDADKNKTPRKSTQQENYVQHATPEMERPTPPKSHISLGHSDVDPKDTFTSSYKNSHKGEAIADDDTVQAPRTAFKSSIALEDADLNRTPRKSTQQENYVYHSTPEMERTAPPKAQINLSQPDADPKDAYTSSYKNSHKGELASSDDQVQAPRSAFKSSIVLEDADKNKTPRQSTHKENYVYHSTPEMEHPTPPKAQINLSQPNIDPKEAFQSSYKQSHRGETPVQQEETVVPRTAFQSSIKFDEPGRATPQSTQKREFVAHAIPDSTPHHAPRTQVDLTMPNVDAKDSFVSSYKNLHKGELPSEVDRASPAPQTAFKSSFVLNNGENDQTPQQSTQRGEYIAHPVSETQNTPAPKAHVDLSMPNVDPKDRFQSSYKNQHTGELPSSADKVSTVPSTAFKSSVVLDDGERSRTPQQSTQRGEYKAHPVTETQATPAPKAQVDLSMPNVDPKEAFQSSYKNQHKGEIPSSAERASPAPQTAFKSNVVLDDGDKNRTAQQSTQRGEFPVHALPNVQPHHAPQPQVDLSMPNVDPKDTFQSSYKNLHKGEVSNDTRAKSPNPPSAFKSTVVFDDGEKNRSSQQSTQRDEYVAHTIPDSRPISSPKPQVNLSQPDVDQKELYKSSYQTMHRGESPVLPRNAPSPVPRSAFQSSFLLDGGATEQEPMMSTSRRSYAAGGDENTARRGSADAGQINANRSPKIIAAGRASNYLRDSQESLTRSPRGDSVESGRSSAEEAGRGSRKESDAGRSTNAVRSSMDQSPRRGTHETGHDSNQSSRDNQASSRSATTSGRSAAASGRATQDSERPTAGASQTAYGHSGQNDTESPQKSGRPVVAAGRPSHNTKDSQRYSQNSSAHENASRSSQDFSQDSAQANASRTRENGQTGIHRYSQAGGRPSSQTSQRDYQEGTRSNSRDSQSLQYSNGASGATYEYSEESPRDVKSSGRSTEAGRTTYEQTSQSPRRESNDSRRSVTSAGQTRESGRPASASGTTYQYADHNGSQEVANAGRSTNEYNSGGSQRYKSSQSSQREYKDSSRQTNVQDYQSPQREVRSPAGVGSRTTPQDHSIQSPRRGSSDTGRTTRSSITMGNGDASPRMSTSSSTYARPPQEAIANQGSPVKPRHLVWDSSISMGEPDRASTPVPTSREAYMQRPSTPEVPAAGRSRDQISFGSDVVVRSYASSSSSSTPRPQTAPSNRSDSQRSSIPFSSGEPTFSPRMTSSSSPSSSPTLPSSPNNKTRSSITFGNDQPSYQTTNKNNYTPSPPRSSSPTLSPSLSPSRPSSASSASRQSQLRSSFSLG